MGFAARNLTWPEIPKAHRRMAASPCPIWWGIRTPDDPRSNAPSPRAKEESVASAPRIDHTKSPSDLFLLRARLEARGPSGSIGSRASRPALLPKRSRGNRITPRILAVSADAARFPIRRPAIWRLRSPFPYARNGPCGPCAGGGRGLPSWDRTCPCPAPFPSAPWLRRHGRAWRQARRSRRR